MRFDELYRYICTVCVPRESQEVAGVANGILTPNEARYMRKLGSQKVLKLIAGRTDPITGQRIELYWERVGRSRGRFVEYRDGREVKDWIVGAYDTFTYGERTWHGNQLGFGRRYI